MLIGLIVAVTWVETSATTPPAWLEPRGLNIIEMVGQVPKAYLHGLILSYTGGGGLVVYDSGRREGDTVVVTTTLYPRFSTPAWAPNQMLTTFGCLGQTPNYDHLGSVVPTSTLRIYLPDGSDVTSHIQFMYRSYMDRRPPAANSLHWLRYLPEYDYGPWRTYPLPLEPEGLVIPPNSGCRIQIPGVNYYPLVGVFTLTVAPSAQVSVAGAQSATFRSYIGPGNVGLFQPLMSQLQNAYGLRHERIPLVWPEAADYFVLKFPPMPGDAYTDSGSDPPYYNADRPTGGSYRLSNGDLSTDLTFSAGFPLQVAWQDTDQAPGSEFLPMLSGLTDLAPPEYVLPAGIGYDPCFTQGNCSGDILQQIYDAEMALEIIYLAVARPPAGVEWLPLKMAGPAWTSSAGRASPAAAGPARTTVPAAGAPGRLSYTATLTFSVHLPLVLTSEEQLTGCPCGWFDGLGRMLDYTPGP